MSAWSGRNQAQKAYTHLGAGQEAVQPQRERRRGSRTINVQNF